MRRRRLALGRADRLDARVEIRVEEEWKAQPVASAGIEPHAVGRAA
jgi:hypothetical protein